MAREITVRAIRADHDRRTVDSVTVSRGYQAGSAGRGNNDTTLISLEIDGHIAVLDRDGWGAIRRFIREVYKHNTVKDDDGKP